MRYRRRMKRLLGRSPARLSSRPFAAQAPSPHARNRGLTAVEGIKVGHHTLTERPTGCTVILVDGDAVGGVSQRGGAPGTRETDLLDPLNMVDKVNAVVLAGGSAFGLEAATGTVRWLEEHNIGWPAGPSKRADCSGRDPVRPRRRRQPEDPADRRLRLQGRRGGNHGHRLQEGSVGAGAGATVGKFGGPGPLDESRASAPRRSRSRAASSSPPSSPSTRSATSSIRRPERSSPACATRTTRFADARDDPARRRQRQRPRAGENTTIGLVATNAKLTKAQATRMALMADDGYARAISPSHTNGDGDTIFSLATGRWDGNADITLIGALAAEAMADAIVRAATQATGVAGIPAARDLKK